MLLRAWQALGNWVYDRQRARAYNRGPGRPMSTLTPYRMCQRYANGHMDRSELVKRLIGYPYVKGDQTDGYDSLLVDPPGVWSEVSDARRHGLIEDDVYDEVFQARHGGSI